MSVRAAIKSAWIDWFGEFSGTEALWDFMAERIAADARVSERSLTAAVAIDSIVGDGTKQAQALVDDLACAGWVVVRAELWQAAEDVVLQEGRHRLGIGFSTIPSGAIDRLRRALEASR